MSLSHLQCSSSPHVDILTVRCSFLRSTIEARKPIGGVFCVFDKLAFARPRVDMLRVLENCRLWTSLVL